MYQEDLYNPLINPDHIKEINTTNDLIACGVFLDARAASYILRHGLGPTYQRMGHAYLFLKQDVLTWLEALGRLQHAGEDTAGTRKGGSQKKAKIKKNRDYSSE